MTSTTIKFAKFALREPRPMLVAVQAMQELSNTWDESGFSSRNITNKQYGQEILSMLCLAAFYDADRNAYMAQETITEAAKRKDDGEPNDEEVFPEDAQSEARKSSKPTKTQYEKVIKFAEARHMDHVLGESFKGKDKKQRQPKEDTAAAAEESARHVFTVASSLGYCFQYQQGKCRRTNCRFKHEMIPKPELEQQQQSKPTPTVTAPTSQPKPAQGTPVPAAKPNLLSPQKKTVMATRFGEMDSSSSSDERDAKGGYVVLTAAVQRKQRLGKVPLNWDTAAMDHIANAKAVLDTTLEYKGRREVTGIGGQAQMTHVGNSSLFQLPRMKLIPNSGVPNLKSVGRSVQADYTGREALAIFGPHGAMQIRATKEEFSELEQLLEKYRDCGLVEADAVQRGYVYVEEFNCEEPEQQLEPEGDDKVLVAAAGINLFAGRVRMDGAAAAVDLLAKAGLSQEVIADAVEKKTIKGLPESITPLSVKRYFTAHGVGEAAMEAGITRAVRRAPLDYLGERTTVPGETLMLDNMDHRTRASRCRWRAPARPGR